MRTVSVLGRTLCVLAALAAAAHAQFLGYTSPQTSQQTLATNLLCTGSAQVFVVNNIGQTQHFLTISNVTGAQKLTAEIDGIDRQGNVFTISDILQVATGSGSVQGSGYFPKVQVSITCSPGTATFTASYSGTSSTVAGDVGNYLAGQIDKVMLTAWPSNSTTTVTVNTPYGSSAGTLFVKFATSGVAANISISCAGGNNLGLLPGTIATMGTNATLAVQTLPMPTFACLSVTMQYTAGAAGGTVSIEYVFTQPGAIPLSNDPCQNAQQTLITSPPTMPYKTSVAITAAGASTTLLVTASTITSAIYVCGYQVGQITTAGTVQFEYGTGGTCGAGTTALTGAIATPAPGPVSYGDGSSTIFRVPANDNLCIVVAGGAVGGVLTYVNAP